MALTESNSVALGTRAPDFELLDVANGGLRNLTELRGERGTLVMFICNHCPYVKHVEQELRDLAGDYSARDISFIAISANDIDANPEDAPQYMAEREYPFPYLYDETQQVARNYNAACTPDFFLFDEKLGLVYHGQIDDSRPGNDIEPSGADLREAMDLLLAGEELSSTQTPSIGCNIKWRD